MNKIKVLLLCAVMMLAFAAVAFAENDSPDSTAESVCCAAVVGTEYNSLNGFEFPSDVKLIGDSSDVPPFEGGKGGNIVEIGKKTYFRAILPAGSDVFSVTYDLTSKAKAEPNEDGKDVFDEDAEAVQKEGAVIDGSAVIGIFVSGSSAVDADIINATLEFTDEDKNSYICRTEICVNRPYTVIADTPDKVKFESVSLYLAGDVISEKTLSILTSLPHSSKSSDVSVIGECDLLSVISHSGKLTFENGALVLGTDTEDVTVSVIPSESAVHAFDHTVFAFIKCADGEGSVSAVSADKGYTESSHAIFKNSGSVAVRASRNGDSAVRLRFRSAVGQKLVLSSVICCSTDEKTNVDGSFTSLTFADGRLNAVGKISTDIVTEYQNATLGLFTKSTTADGEAVLLSEIKMTSRFSFSLSLSLDKYPHAQTDNVFFVGVITDDGTFPVTRERFVSPKSGVLPPEGILGLHGANPISVFESGVSNILIEVDLSKFIVPASASSTTLSRNGFIYGINTEYLKQLDSDVNFYRSIGVSVQIRYICTESIRSRGDGSHLTYDGLFESELMLRGDTSESVNIYPSVTSFLSQRYENISSFIISSGVNSTALTGINHDRLWSCVSDIALISHLVYSSASEYIPDVTVSIPLVLSDDGTYASAEVFAALFGERLMSLGDIPWSLVYTADGASPSVLCENIKTSLRLNGGSSPLSFTVIYEATAKDGDSTAGYESFCDACNTSSVKQVFLSVKNIGHVLSRESYSALKNYGNTKESFIFTGDAESYDKLSSLTVTGTAPLWDFSTTYSPEGWNAGYGIASLQSSSAFGADRSRVLRAITDTTSPAGIFLCSLKESIDLRNAALAEFVFDLDTDDSANIVFIFGNDTKRAEYSLGDADIYEKDGKLHAFCDLSAYTESAGSISYAGVIIYSDERSTFELSKVNVHSTTLDSDSLAASLKVENEEDEEKVSPEFIIGGAAAVFVMLCIGVRITSILAKQDAKNKASQPVRKRKF